MAKVVEMFSFCKRIEEEEQKKKPTRSKCSLLGPMRVRVFGNIPTTGCFQPADVEAWMVFCFSRFPIEFDGEMSGDIRLLPDFGSTGD